MADENLQPPQSDVVPTKNNEAKNPDSVLKIKEDLLTGRKPREVLESLSLEDRLTSSPELVVGYYDNEKYFDAKEALDNELLLGEISREEYEQEVLELLGVETDNQGRIVLYHATTASGLISIVADGAIRTAEETGNFAWRTGGEIASEDEGDKDKTRKIYLATKKEIVKVARSLQTTTPDGVYILEVQVPKEKLEPDEDSHKNNWVDSLGSAFHSCAHRGAINNFNTFARLRPDPYTYMNQVAWKRGPDHEDLLNKFSKFTKDDERRSENQEAVNLYKEGIDISRVPIIRK